MGGLVITTTDKNLLTNINSAAIDGVVVNKNIVAGRNLQIMSASAILTTDASTISDTVDIAVNLTKEVAPLFVAWLTAYLKKKKSGHIKINGVEVSGKDNDVQIQITNYINCNICNSEQEKKE